MQKHLYKCAKTGLSISQIMGIDAFFIIMTGNIHPDDRRKSSGRLQKMS